MVVVGEVWKSTPQDHVIRIKYGEPKCQGVQISRGHSLLKTTPLLFRCIGRCISQPLDRSNRSSAFS